MKKFELWLDESGDFENDVQKKGNGAKPSLIGGLLSEISSFPEHYINTIIPEDETYHSVNEDDQLERFKMINEKLFQNKNNRFIVFSNEERIMIIDNNLTYLNIIAAGILQLIKRLKAQYGEVFLRVVIANRVDTTTGLDPGDSVVPQDEYEKRLKEKLIIDSIDNSISDNCWEIQTASARRDKRLMLADIVCNSFFTRGRRKKFTSEERAYINDIYTDDSKTLVFTVFETVLEKQFRNNLLENRIGEAVANMCLSTDAKVIERCFALLEQRFSAARMNDIRFQYKFIESYIEYYINVNRDFDLCITFLENLLKYYVPLLRKYGSEKYADLLSLDIKFFLLTVYNHKGNIQESDRLINECEQLFAEVPTSLETVNYRIKFDTRKIQSLINSFEYEKALAAADEQVKRCSDVKELLMLISNADTYYYDEYAKALGTRLQIKTLMLRDHKSLYDSAKQDSDAAIEEFVRQSDKKRQYLYRTDLEIEHGSYDEALHCLKMYAGLKDEASVNELWNALQQESEFAVSAYVKLMSAAQNKSYSEDMFKALSNSSYIQELKKQYHPVEIIYWKLAHYYAISNVISAAEKYYDMAMDVCFAEDELTLNAIGFGIGFEMIGMIMAKDPKKANARKKQLNKKWNKLKEDNNSELFERLLLLN